MRTINRKQDIILGVIALILIALPLTLFLLQRQQDTRQRAAEGDACYTNVAVNLLVDKSFSMSNNSKMTVLKSALTQFVNTIGTANSDVYIGMDVFGAPENPPGGAFTELDFTRYSTNSSTILNEINSLAPGVAGGTYMRKGFEVALAKINAAKTRPELQGYSFVTVVFSDGIPEVSGHWGSQCSAQAGTLQTSSYICFAIAQDPRTAPSRVAEMKNATDKVYSVVIYSDSTTSRDYPLNSQLLQLMRDVSDDPDSTYFFDATTSNVSELNTIFQTIPQTICPEPTPTPTHTPTPVPTLTPTPLPPTLTLTANPISVSYNGTTTLTWTSTNTTSCTASGAWTGTKAASGSQASGPLTSASTFTLTCSGPGGSITRSASVTVGAAPTLTPTPTRTPTPLPTNTPTPVPTNTPIPTATPVPQSTRFSVTAFLHGLGNSGDNANPTEHSLSNKNPVRVNRGVELELHNASGVIVKKITGVLAYNSTNGNFTGTFDGGLDIQSGTYTMKAKSPQYLRKSFTGILSITNGQTHQLPVITFVTGDINNDNSLSILDYNILIGCYSDFAPPASCNSVQKPAADLTDDGSVNQFDYNLFLRDFSTQSGD